MHQALEFVLPLITAAIWYFIGYHHGVGRGKVEQAKIMRALWERKED